MISPRKPLFFVLLALALVRNVHGEEQAAVPEDRSRFHLFLLAGQSNMAGRGKVDVQDQQPHPRVLMLDKSGRWVPAEDPLHFDKPNVVGVGIGKTFGIDYAKANPDITVGLIPCAVGGSPIASWQPGGYHPQTDSHPYDDAMKRTSLAVNTGTLKGILWHQGESDSNAQASEIYQQKLHELIARFRKVLDSPDLPFIAGQMGQFADRPWNHDRHRVDAAHRALASEVANTALASSKGLNHRGDKVHFDSASYRELGHRYYKSYQSVVDSNPE